MPNGTSSRPNSMRPQLEQPPPAEPLLDPELQLTGPTIPPEPSPPPIGPKSWPGTIGGEPAPPFPGEPGPPLPQHWPGGAQHGGWVGGGFSGVTPFPWMVRAS